MNGNNFYKATVREIKETSTRINHDLTGKEVELIAKSRYWKKYSGASGTTDKEILKGKELDSILNDVEFAFDYPELN